ncbi:NADPH-dependent FMN reductase [Acetobacter estunensis NRIC 0472]|uniref:NADPH-dependent oxidoreductase n=1 Tax=Acetobacter estunensis TaxID=104097 RepID=A0A967B4R3_9PROT|nr:NAD(P)H-dependent oxidoreductase [Acetobacter estunensis]NHO52399.1 NADPH-dependent oxidoreductase [Acetobacter estunensis]GBQ25880.1 NADPH-dependent FMN reductase [Acetobacter estunensis NRIC 0472]
MKITMLCGNPSAGGRTTALGMEVARALASLLGAQEPSAPIELAEHTQGLFSWGHEELAAVVREVAESDFIVIATPTYKASFTGLLKSFLDQYGAGSLRNRVVLPVFTGGSAAHSLAPDYTLRPLLAELGASVPGSSLYVMTSELERQSEIVADYIEVNRYVLLGAAHGVSLARQGVEG